MGYLLSGIFAFVFVVLCCVAGVMLLVARKGGRGVKVMGEVTEAWVISGVTPLPKDLAPVDARTCKLTSW